MAAAVGSADETLECLVQLLLLMLLMMLMLLLLMTMLLICCTQTLHSSNVFTAHQQLRVYNATPHAQ